MPAADQGIRCCQPRTRRVRRPDRHRDVRFSRSRTCDGAVAQASSKCRCLAAWVRAARLAYRRTADSSRPVVQELVEVLGDVFVVEGDDV
jgi:hypothetical protein